MDITKVVFETLDKLLDKSYNENPEIQNLENIEVIYDEKYSDDKNCNMDLYRDVTLNGRLPVVLYIHGGGFVAGGKEFRRTLARWYASRGFFVLNVNYGLCPDCVFPEQIKNLADVLAWIKKNAKTYNLDLDKLVVAGDSAGAYFASMLACVTEDEKLQKKLGVKTDLHFVGAILNCGLYDLKSILDRRLALGLNNKIFEAFAGIKKEDIYEYEYKDTCSPLKMVNKKFPPTFLIYAKKDVFCAGQAEKLEKKFIEKNIYYESFYSTSPFLNHCFSLEWKNKSTEKVMDLQSLFLEKIKNGELPKTQAETTICVYESE